MNSDPHWKWTHYHTKVSHESLPLIFSFYRNECGPSKVGFEGLEISLSKSLMYCDEVGWNWHKSWNLPNISISLKKSLSSEERNSEELWVSLYLLKRLDRLDTLTSVAVPDMRMIDLGLKGKSQVRLTSGIDDKFEFSSLKITTTSFSHQGEKFYLLLNISGTSQENTQGYLSPPFFIDSREAARKNANSQYKQLLPFIEPFMPGVLFREFFKGKNRSVKNKGDIENSFEGMYNYLSAPNIRFKVKHPLFLLIKFSETLILYHRKSSNHKIKKENLIVEFQNALLANYKNKIKSEGKDHKNTEFIILAKHFHSKDKKKTQKINGLLHIIDEYLIGIVSKESEIPNGYYPYSQIDDLRYAYRMAYPLINSEKINAFSNIFTARKIDDHRKNVELGECQTNPRKKLKLEEKSDGNHRTFHHFDNDRTAAFKEIDPVLEPVPNLSIICSTNSKPNSALKAIARSGPSLESVATEKKPVETEEIRENAAIMLQNTVNFMNFYDYCLGSMMYAPDFLDFTGKAFLNMFLPSAGRTKN